jgi:SAM-dependent methyltransferase
MKTNPSGRSEDTRQLYDEQAQDWKRDAPLLLSDYSARPFVIELCKPLQNKSVLDAGCGEGYVARKILDAGAAFVHGADISAGMIDQANAQITENQKDKCHFETADLRTQLELPKAGYDLVLAMFLFNYLDAEATAQVMQRFFHCLKPGGHFIFSVPHPSLAYLKKDKFPFYFETRGGYFSGRNALFPGEIWRRDGISVGVQCVHKTVEDYFSCLRSAGFRTMPEVYELHITDEHIEMDPNFFTPLCDLPLHMAFKVEKS